MQYFVISLPSSVIGLSLLSTFLLCQEDKNSGAFLQILNSLDDDLVKEIENNVSCSVNKIQTILAGGDKPAQNDIIKNLSSSFTNLLNNFYLESKNIKKIKQFLNEEFAPSHVPNYFFCAWIIVTEVLRGIFQKELMNKLQPKIRILFQIADEILHPGGKVANDPDIRPMLKDEFIIILKKLAPELNQTLIQNVADYGMGEYTYQGRVYRYYEKVLVSFKAWSDYLDSSKRNFKRALIPELEEYYKVDWKVGGRKLALILARDYFLGNSVNYYFWEQYQTQIAYGDTGDFEEILASMYPDGWYYTTESIDLFHLVIRAMKKADLFQKNITLGYEPIFKDQNVGIPQSTKCRVSKKDFNYYFERWIASSSTKTIPIHNV